MGGMISAWRSMGQDPSVLKQKVKPGTAKRTIAFALPYTGLLTVFLLVVIVDASITSLSARSFVSVRSSPLEQLGIVCFKCPLIFSGHLLRVV